MKSHTLYGSLFVFFAAAARAADLSNFKAGTGVEAELQEFLTTYFPFSEDPDSTTEWTNWWTDAGTITRGGKTYTGAEERLGLKNVLLPPGGTVTWNHIVYDVVVQAETDTSKTYNESVIVEVANTATGACGGYQGFVVAEIAKGSDGNVNLAYHSQNYITYILDLPSASNAACVRF